MRHRIGRWLYRVGGAGGGLALLALVIGLVAPAPFARAQEDRRVVVTRRDGAITIQPNGDVAVVETWQVRFIGGPFRFAFRSIPLERVERIDGWSVSEDGRVYRQSSNERPGSFTLATEDGAQRITWYFEPTRDATRVFTLGYTLHGVLRIYPDGDQFFWKFIEADRGYPIEQAQVTVHLPETFAPEQLRATTYRNTREAPGAQIVDGTTVRFSGEDFAPGVEWEIRVQFPHGVVPATPPAWQAADDARRAEEAAIRARQPIYNLLALVAAMLILIGGGLGVYLLWYLRGRDAPVSSESPVLTAPPDDTPPGVVGTLLDERADMQDILATLVDLARRGYFQIVEHAPQGWFSSAPADFSFVRGSADPDQLRPFERRLYDQLFGMTLDRRDLSSLKNQFYSEIAAIQDELYAEAVRLGYFAHKPNAVRNRYTALGLLALGLTVALGFLGGPVFGRYTPLFALVVIAAGIVSVALIVVSRFMSRKTEAGARAARRWRAFRRYLQQLERYTELDQARELFDRYLPYAIAFGLEREWVRRFERVETPAPPWYQPYGWPVYGGRPVIIGANDGGPLRGGSGHADGGSRGGGGMPSLDQAAGRMFGGLNSMSSGLFAMLNTTAATFTAQPQSSGSGGFSGGFSGGGGGGGGSGGGSSGFG